MLSFVRLHLAVVLGLLACGGRTDLGVRATPSDGGAAPPRGFKVVYRSLIMPAPLVWHSIDGSTTPFSFKTLGPFTYDGTRTAVATDAIYVLDATGAIVRAQPLPLGAQAYVAPRPDAQRLLVSTLSADAIGTLDADGTYHPISALDPL